MSQPGAEFVLGTAQLGAAYGRTNSFGALSDTAAFALLEDAYRRGVRAIDTARAYGPSEARIGAFVRAHGLRDLRIFTKLSPLADLAPDAPAAAAESAVDRSVEDSLAALGVPQLPVLMLHRSSHARAFGGAILRALGRWQARGSVGQLGASINTLDEARDVFDRPGLQHVQLPYNMLDRRFDREPPPPDRPRIHVRSVFLQGLLAQPDMAVWPDVPGYDREALGRDLAEAAKAFGRASVRDLALAYVRAQSWIDGYVIGVERPEQLADTLALSETPALSATEVTILRDRLPQLPDALLQPWLWPPRASRAP